MREVRPLLLGSLLIAAVGCDGTLPVTRSVTDPSNPEAPETPMQMEKPMADASSRPPAAPDAGPGMGAMDHSMHGGHAAPSGSAPPPPAPSGGRP